MNGILVWGCSPPFIDAFKSIKSPHSSPNGPETGTPRKPAATSPPASTPPTPHLPASSLSWPVRKIKEQSEHSSVSKSFLVRRVRILLEEAISAGDFSMPIHLLRGDPFQGPGVCLCGNK